MNDGRITHTNGAPIRVLEIPEEPFKGKGGAAPPVCRTYKEGECNRTTPSTCCNFPFNANTCPHYQEAPNSSD